jgi:hypothetical protein
MWINNRVTTTNSNPLYVVSATKGIKIKQDVCTCLYSIVNPHILLPHLIKFHQTGWYGMPQRIVTIHSVETY